MIEYRVTAREAKDVFTLTNVSAERARRTRPRRRTQVLVPGLSVKLDRAARPLP